MITAEEVLSSSKPPKDRAAYEAGRAHFLKRCLGPMVKSMEESWVRYGWVKQPSEKVMQTMAFRDEVRFTTETANQLYFDRWDFPSWQQGVWEAQFGIDRGYTK